MYRSFADQPADLGSASLFTCFSGPTQPSPFALYPGRTSSSPLAFDPGPALSSPLTTLDPVWVSPDFPLDLPCPHAACLPLPLSPLANVPSTTPAPGGGLLLVMLVGLGLARLSRRRASSF